MRLIFLMLPLLLEQCLRWKMMQEILICCLQFMFTSIALNGQQKDKVEWLVEGVGYTYLTLVVAVEVKTALL
jgi:hypothetical protein